MNEKKETIEKEIDLDDYSKFVSGRYRVKTVIRLGGEEIRTEDKIMMHEDIMSQPELDEHLKKYNEWIGFIVSIELI